MQVNEEKRKKFMEYAGKRVNNVLHDIQILEPMSRSASYDFTRQDVDEMFTAMQETLNNAKAEFEKKFEEKARSEKKTFSFGTSTISTEVTSEEAITSCQDNCTTVDDSTSITETTSDISCDTIPESANSESYSENSVETTTEIF